MHLTFHQRQSLLVHSFFPFNLPYILVSLQTKSLSLCSPRGKGGFFCEMLLSPSYPSGLQQIHSFFPFPCSGICPTFVNPLPPAENSDCSGLPKMMDCERTKNNSFCKFRLCGCFVANYCYILFPINTTDALSVNNFLYTCIFP